MKNIKIFIYLTRLNKPIGYMLLFWPCSWGLLYANNISENSNLVYFLILFFLGSLFMRSAGCIVNDIVDKDLDKKVLRTKNRPLANGSISTKKSLYYVFILCGLSFVILLQFNFLTIILGIGSMFFAFSYPYMKRFTYWPQLFLGITFNWGIIMASAAILNYIPIDIVLLYLSAIFWTLGYDTIYGAQDIIDDEIIGIKSTSIKFKNNIKTFVSLCYFISLIIMFYILYDKINNNISILFLILFTVSLIIQIIIFDKKKPHLCLKAFKINNFSGFFLFFALLN